MKTALLLLMLFFSFLSYGEDEATSAYRDPDIPYELYVERALEGMSPVDIAATPLGAARRYGSSSLPSATSWNGEPLQSHFRKMRDSRFLRWSSRPSFPRRSTWLYPDDGCYARATMANRNFSNWGISPPKKVFVFGNLRVRTRNNPRGYVSWWYHVAPIVQIGGNKYVLDPAIEPSKPLALYSWLDRMGTPSNIKVAICSSGSYGPKSSCSRVITGSESSASQQRFLSKEWNRLRALGRNPERELGQDPPW